MRDDVASEPVLRAAALQARIAALSSAEILDVALREAFPGRIAVVSSFGAEAACLLHLVAAVDPATPVLFVDTGRHFAETLAYRDRLAGHLGLRDLRVVRPAEEACRRLDADLTRAIWDPDGCCAFRKIAPLEAALSGFDAWITGRRRTQAATRAAMPVVELDGRHVKVNPLAAWTEAQSLAYLAAHELPAHPLVAEGFSSIGCAPCTSAVAPGEDPRAGRWRGMDKTECGIHRRIVEPSGK